MTPPINSIRDALLLYFLGDKETYFNINSQIVVSKLFKKIITNSKWYINQLLKINYHFGTTKTVFKLIERGAVWNKANIHVFNLSDNIVYDNINLNDYNIIMYLSATGQIYKYIPKMLLQKTISYYEFVLPWLTGCSHDYSLTSFISLWNLVNNKKIMKFYHNEILFDETNDVLNLIASLAIINSIENNNYKLFKYLHDQEDIKARIYNYYTEEGHFINKIINNRQTNWLNMIDFKVKSTLMDIFSMIAVLDYANDNEALDDLMILLLNKILDNYDNIPYHMIISKIITYGKTELIEKIIAHGYDITLLISEAFNQCNITYLFTYIQFAGILERPDIQKAIEDIILSNLFNINKYDLIYYYKINEKTPDIIVRRFLAYY